MSAFFQDRTYNKCGVVLFSEWACLPHWSKVKSYD